MRLAVLLTLALAAVAADPTLTVNPATIIYQKGDAAVVIDRAATFTADAPASGFMENATITVGLTPVQTDDVLAIADVAHPIGAGITVATRVWSEGQVVRTQAGEISNDVFTGSGPVYTIADFTGGTSNEALVITFGRDATPEMVLAVLRSITYVNQDAFNPTIGTRTITVVLSDGTGTTLAASATTAVRVVNYNAPPVTTALSLTTLEDGDLSGSLAASWSDADSDPGHITYYQSGTPTGGEMVSFDRNTGDFVFRPTSNSVTAATFSFTVHDETNVSNVSSVTISITAVNDAPSFTKGADVTVAQDSGPNTISGWATSISPGPADESAQTVSFTTSTTNNSLFAVLPAVDAAGTLTFTPANLKHGSCVVTVTAHDTGTTDNGGTNTSAGQTFVLTLTPVYYEPTITTTHINSVVGVDWAGTISVTTVNDDPAYTYTVTGMSRLGELTVDAVTGAITFAPQRAGDEEVPIEVSDGYRTATGVIGIHISDWSGDRPRIISTPAAETVTAGTTWQYDVIVDPTTVLASGILAGKIQNNGDATISKISGNRFRITWATPSSGTVYHKFGVVVWDSVNNQSDYQSIILVLTPAIGGDG